MEIITNNMAEVSSSKFSLHRLVDCTKRCGGASVGEIPLDSYLETFRELNKFFHLLGTLFGFVISDVKEKISILENYRAGSYSEQYSTVQSLINYEITNDITTVKGKPPSGARTLLRLHRALEFIIHFMNDIKNAEGDQKLGGIAGNSYKETLAKHHIWLVRKTVGLALYALPTRDHLLEKMGEESLEMAAELIAEVVSNMQPLYDTVQQLYSTNNLLQLP